MLFHSEIYILYCIDISAFVQVGTAGEGSWGCRDAAAAGALLLPCTCPPLAPGLDSCRDELGVWILAAEKLPSCWLACFGLQPGHRRWAVLGVCLPAAVPGTLGLAVWRPRCAAAGPGTLPAPRSKAGRGEAAAHPAWERVGAAGIPGPCWSPPANPPCYSGPCSLVPSVSPPRWELKLTKRAGDELTVQGTTLLPGKRGWDERCRAAAPQRAAVQPAAPCASPSRGALLPSSRGFARCWKGGCGCPHCPRCPLQPGCPHRQGRQRQELLPSCPATALSPTALPAQFVLPFFGCFLGVFFLLCFCFISA